MNTTITLTRWITLWLIVIIMVLLGFMSTNMVQAAVDDPSPGGGGYGNSREGGGNTSTGDPVPTGSLMSMSLGSTPNWVYRGAPVRMNWDVNRGQCYTTGGFDNWARGSAGNFASKYSTAGAGNYNSTANGTYNFNYYCYGPVSVKCGESGGKSGDWRCTTTNGYLSLRRSVTVREPLPTCTLFANPSSTITGDTVTLTWSSNNATAAGTITNNVDSTSWSVNPQNASSSQTATPAQTITYQLNVRNSAGDTGSCTRTVTVSGTAPTATISGTDCTIAAGASTCNSSLTWNISGGDPSVKNLTSGAIYSLAYNGTNVPKPINYGANDIAARHVTTNLATTTVNATCATDTTWNGSVCASDAAPTPSATISATDCTILVGASTCDSAVTWNIQNATTPNAYNSTNNTPYAYAAIGNSALYPIDYGDNDIVARDGTNILAGATAVATASCESGSAWNTVTELCESTTSPSLGVDFSLTTASIPTTYIADPVAGTYSNVVARMRMRNVGDTDYDLDASNNLVAGTVPIYAELTSLFTGQTAPSVPQLTDTPQASPSMTLRGTVTAAPQGELSNYVNTNTFTVPIPFGTHDFCVYAARDQQSGTYESWDVDNSNNDACFSHVFPVPQPAMTLIADKQLVRVGDSATLTWDVNVTYDLNCTLRGPGGINLGPLNFKNAAQQVSPTSALQSSGKFVLECTEPLTGTTFSEDLSVEVVPDFEEI